MMQNEKKLLLIDLCSRLPYGVKGIEANSICLLNTSVHFKSSLIKNIEYKIVHLGFKPYLFPLSSMTEEQDKEFALLQTNVHTSGFLFASDCSDMINWLNKNHFDYRGLIPMGLALDATGLNIY